ncbi:uncharacterized protein LOC131636025 [Vicia villosa]|uniref:uncharacterized protein LOC131636025 n=1 Tax=Vicia villosa TaxID=3911 RepID=UPI00273AF0AC|nr:uncharacterized protein LOC131636025 [Vicia villosa]
MAVDLHTSATHDSSFPYDSDFTRSNNFNFNGSDSNPHFLISRQIRSHTSTTTTTSLPRELTHQHMEMSLPQNHKLGSSCIASDDLDSLKPLETSCCWSQQSSLWSPLYSNQSSPEGSLSPNEPASVHDSDCYDMVKMLEKMNLEENGNSKFKSHSLESQHHVGVGSSHEYILNEQIRANQLSRLRQEQILSLKQKLMAYRENHSYASPPQFQKNGKEVDVGFKMARSGSLNRRTGSEKLPHFQEATGSRGPSCGTGVFLPRGGVSTMFQSQSKRPGKGCSTVLIPERVVQALQLHFEQIAATSGPKPRAIPPLHDVLVSTNRDGMYSLQKRQSRKKPTQVQNEMILPREWTY